MVANNEKNHRRMTKEDKIIGTPLYIAPEQEESSEYGIKADIYSLGILLFEILSNFKTSHSRVKEILYLREKGNLKPSFIEQFP